MPSQSNGDVTKTITQQLQTDLGRLGKATQPVYVSIHQCSLRASCKTLCVLLITQLLQFVGRLGSRKPV